MILDQFAYRIGLIEPKDSVRADAVRSGFGVPKL